MAISSTGIGSMLDVDSIVTQLVALERAPIAKLQSAATFMQTQISAYGQVQSLVSALRDAAAALAKPALWQKASATSSDAIALGASATGAATPGNYSVLVGQLASAQTLASAGFAAGSTVVGAGKLTLALGRWDATVTTLTPKTGTTPVVLDFTDSSTTLAQVRDRINAAGAGVIAAIVTDANGARLALTSAKTGLDDQLQVTATDAAGSPLAGGLAALQYPASGGLGLTQKQPAANAGVTINGIDIESASNQISGALDGVSLALLKSGGAAVNVSVSSDTTTQRKALQDFATAYNGLNSYLAEQTKYDDAAKVGGSLQGDSTAVGLRNRMRGLLRETNSASPVFARLADVGFDVQRDGSIKLDATKLDKGLARVGELAKLFSSVTPGNPAGSGLASRFLALGDALTKSDGTLTARNAGLQARLERNRSDQERLEGRVERTRDKLLKQYQALDARMGQLSGLSTYMTQQLTMLNNQFKASDN